MRGDTVTADLSRVLDIVAVIASIDLEAQPTAVFDQHSTGVRKPPSPQAPTRSMSRSVRAMLRHRGRQSSMSGVTSGSSVGPWS